MIKIVFTNILLCISLVQFGQIVADHTIVDQYDDIPQYYIDKVKKMLLIYAGESHSEGIGEGLKLLEAANSKYQVNVTTSGPPESYTTTHLREDRVTYGDLNYPWNWVRNYGEEDWYKTATAKTRTKDGITYCNGNGYIIAAMGFGWCWDGEETELDMPDYLRATQEYIDYCLEKSYPTQIFFTTGPVDNENYTAIGETGYHKYLAYEAIRDYVDLNPTRVLFDYADILSYDTPNGSPNTTSWNGHTFPIITATNEGDGSIAHIGSEGVLKLAKAMWWMLARIAGWDGGVTSVLDTSEKESQIWTEIKVDELNVHIPSELSSGKVNIYTLEGSLKASKQIYGDLISFNISFLPSGLYILVIRHSAGAKSQKIILP